jgi:glucose-fructose oxidoreductase
LRKWRVVGVNFDHIHMGDLLREVAEHPDAEIAGICDRQPARMAGAIAAFDIPPERVFTDVRALMTTCQADLVVLCPATADHAAAVEEAAPYGVDMLVEKPFAASLRDADRMIAAAERAAVRLAINWPLAWYPPHVTTRRLIREKLIGEIIEVHFYDGNRGPGYHLADKVEVSDEEAQRSKATSWWYKAASGGGSLLDYLGYGATLGTWFMDERAPLAVTSVVDETEGLEVDEHSITICRYATGLSKFETRWGTFTDPWTLQPQPKCGFVVVGTEGTISSYDFEPHVGVQTRSHREVRYIPVDALQAPFRKPIEYVLHCKGAGAPIEGPLSPRLCRIAQRIVDTAALSVRRKRTLELIA